jgi:elongator complex protein 2
MALMSTSLDQTTRLFAEHTVPGCWYELGRPQIHGYDMNTLCTVKNLKNSETSKGNYLSSKILSGGDEKVLRLFEAPYNYVKTMNSLSPHIG